MNKIQINKLDDAILNLTQISGFPGLLLISTKNKRGVFMIFENVLYISLKN